jgi:hypothetical protein
MVDHDHPANAGVHEKRRPGKTLIVIIQTLGNIPAGRSGSRWQTVRRSL